MSFIGWGIPRLLIVAQLMFISLAYQRHSNYSEIPGVLGAVCQGQSPNTFFLFYLKHRLKKKKVRMVYHIW